MRQWPVVPVGRGMDRDVLRIRDMGRNLRTLAALSLGLMLGVAACALNPQPEPPLTPGGTGGHDYATGGAGGLPGLGVGGTGYATGGAAGGKNGGGGSGAMAGALDAGGDAAAIPKTEAGLLDGAAGDSALHADGAVRDGAVNVDAAVLDASDGATGTDAGPADAAAE